MSSKPDHITEVDAQVNLERPRVVLRWYELGRPERGWSIRCRHALVDVGGALQCHVQPFY
jgi:hypothetical protein